MMLKACSLGAGFALFAFVATASADLPVEKVTLAKMAPDNGHRLYVLDYALMHGVDGKVHVIDGDSFRILGQITNGQMGSFNIAADGKTLYNATTAFIPTCWNSTIPPPCCPRAKSCSARNARKAPASPR
jgi:methylamine dehydrogenase heavy chain